MNNEDMIKDFEEVINQLDLDCIKAAHARIDGVCICDNGICVQKLSAILAFIKQRSRKSELIIAEIDNIDSGL